MRRCLVVYAVNAEKCSGGNNRVFQGMAKVEWHKAGSDSGGGRGERIRTSGLYVPNVALYQAKLHPVLVSPKFYYFTTLQASSPFSSSSPCRLHWDNERFVFRRPIAKLIISSRKS